MNESKSAQPITMVTLNDGVPRPVKYNFNALVAIEGLTGESIASITNKLMGGDVSFTLIRALIWGGLNFGDINRPLKPEQVGDLLDGVDIGELAVVVGGALMAAFPEPKDKKSDEDEETTEVDSPGEDETPAALEH